MKKTHAHLIALTLILVVVIANTYILNTQRQYLIKQKIILGSEKPGYASLKLTASYDIKVYRQGELVATRHKENDPITIQWYRMLANMMFGFIRDGAVNWLDTGGNQRTWMDTELVTGWSSYETFNPRVYIALGSGAGTPSINDHKLFNEVTKDVAEMSVEDDTSNSQYIVTYTKSFTVSTGFTLTEVGLLLYFDASSGGDKTMVYLLVAHDSVDPSVDLVEGDVVTVTYTITIPYNTNGAFTRWFYNALINYFLGYKGTTGNSLELKAESSNSGCIDTGIDDQDGNKADGEYIYIEIGSSSSGVNPLFETYVLGNVLQRIRIDDQQFLNEINETNTYTIHYVVSFSFTSDATISEIGVSYYTDRVAGKSSAGDYYLWLYWNLASPINVNAGDGLRVEITIEIPYT